MKSKLLNRLCQYAMSSEKGEEAQRTVSRPKSVPSSSRPMNAVGALVDTMLLHCPRTLASDKV